MPRTKGLATAVVPWKVEQKSRNIFKVVVPWERNKAWEQWVLLSSDRHWDNPHSDRRLQKQHLDEAVEKRAIIVDVGDLFCMMQGKYDPRADKGDVRPEHQHGKYLDVVIKDAAEWFAPYAAYMPIIAKGNHEEHIRKRHETDVTDRLCQSLFDKTGHTVYNGQYGGWVRFQFTTGTLRQSVTLRYHHGYGGGGPVTKGIIQTNRRGAFMDADIIASGHIHEKYYLPVMRESLSEQFVLQKKKILHICTGTYKDDYDDGANSWEANRGQPPKPQGAWWLKFYSENIPALTVDGKRESHTSRIRYKAIEAD